MRRGLSSIVFCCGHARGVFFLLRVRGAFYFLLRARHVCVFAAGARRAFICAAGARHVFFAAGTRRDFFASGAQCVFLCAAGARRVFFCCGSVWRGVFSTAGAGGGPCMAVGCGSRGVRFFSSGHGGA